VKSRFLLRIEKEQKQKMADYRGGGLTNMKIREAEKLVENIRHNVEQKKKEAEGAKDLKSAAYATGAAFSTHVDGVEEDLRSKTVGLVTLSELKQQQQNVVAERERQIALKLQEDKKKSEEEMKRKKKEKKRLKKYQNKNKISFGDDEEIVEGETASKKKRLGKDLTVDTSFLPDDGKDDRDMELRNQLRVEWLNQQTKLKNQTLDFEYVYWDGSPHQRELVVKKGDSIETFLQRVRQQLRADFVEMKSQSVDQMMFIKADTIIPHQYTFYDLILTKAEGKSGTLFDFESDQDVTKIETTNVMAKSTVKVCTRTWYEGNKHVYPANIWESYEPEKKYEKFKKSGKLEENSRPVNEVKSRGQRCPNCGYGRGKLGEITYGTCYLCCEYKDGAV